MKRFYPQKKNGRFYQEDQERPRWFLSTISVFFKTLYRDYFAPIGSEAAQWIVKPSYPEQSHEPIFTWLGHSTFLIQVGGKNILTDPIFGSVSGIISRIIPHQIATKDLPRIDYVILSHNHPDHMDATSLFDIKRYNPHVKMLVPMGDKAWFDARGFIDTCEYMWWDTFEQDGLTFTFLPAKHWSQRGMFDKNKSLWGSWMIEHNGFKVYFAGDTAWSKHFKVIGHFFKSIDVAIMPIGPSEPREHMKESHVNAEEAGDGFLHLNARWFVPMHWGTFRLGMDNFKEPVHRIKAWWELNKEKCADKVLKISKVGELVHCVRQNMMYLSHLKSKQNIKSL